MQHALVTKTEQALNEIIEKNHRERSVDSKVYSQKGDYLDTCVYRASVPRALNLWQLFIELCERKGHKVEVVKETSPYVYQVYWTTVFVSNFPVRIRLYQRTKYRERSMLYAIQEAKWAKRKQLEEELNARVPPLVFSIVHSRSLDCTRTWADSYNEPLEEKLERFLKAIVEVARDFEGKKRREEREERNRQRSEKKARIERERVEELRKGVRAWEYAQTVREYLARAIQASESSAMNEGQRRRFEKWVKWANGYADSVDPIHCVSTNVKRKQTPYDRADDYRNQQGLFDYLAARGPQFPN